MSFGPRTPEGRFAPLAAASTKVCTRCGREKPLEAFYRQRRLSAGRSASCKECQSAWQKAHYHGIHLRHRFGMSLDTYEAILAAQEGVCAICGQPPASEGRRLCVDHDHQTDAIRGLLCQNCNAAIGMLQDDPDLVDRAAGYLRRFKEAGI